MTILAIIAAILAVAALHHLSQHSMEKRIMAALDDLAAAEADEEAVLQALLTDIGTLTTDLATANQNNDSDAIEAIVAKMKAAQDAARAALNPPAAQAS